MNQKTQTLQRIRSKFFSEDFPSDFPTIFVKDCCLLVHSVNTSDYVVKLQEAEEQIVA
jgi:hypothetical protein